MDRQPNTPTKQRINKPIITAIIGVSHDVNHDKKQIDQNERVQVGVVTFKLFNSFLCLFLIHAAPNVVD